MLGIASACLVAVATLSIASAMESPMTGPKDTREVVSPGKVDDDAPKAFKTTESGLKYRVLRKGDGDKKPSPTDRVTVHYKGWLDNGTIFDSSYRRGETIAFGLNQVIPGWTEGMQLVSEGGMIELEIPSKLGYGPGGATLHFIVELKKIN